MLLLQLAQKSQTWKRLPSAAIAALSLSAIAACTGQPAATGEAPPPIETSSGRAEVALAEHLASTGAKKYGAYWCPHCHQQQALFGKEAFEKIAYVECDPEGQNSQASACQAAGVGGFPTWEIDGELHPGVQTLESLAELSGYSGPVDFTERAGQ